jgi:hypothetical protein
MPRMSGAQLAAHLRAERLGLPVLLMSGDPGGIEPVNGSGEPVEILAKQFMADVLRATVRQLLAAQHP